MSHDKTQEAIFNRVTAQGGTLEECKERFAREWKAWEQFAITAHSAPDKG